MLKNKSPSLIDCPSVEEIEDRVSEIITGGSPESRLISAINQVRADAGLSSMNWLLDSMAEEHNSMVCRGIRAHSNLNSRAAKYGLSSWGEIWYHTSSPFTGYPSFEAEAVDWWMNSPLHKSIMLGNYSKVGVDVMNCNGTQHFTAVFGT